MYYRKQEHKQPALKIDRANVNIVCNDLRNKRHAACQKEITRDGATPLGPSFWGRTRVELAKYTTRSHTMGFITLLFLLVPNPRHGQAR